MTSRILPKRPSKRTQRVKRERTTLSKRVLPRYRPLVLILGPRPSREDLGGMGERTAFERVGAVGAFAHACGYAPIVPLLARKECVNGDPDARDETTPSIARALGRDGAKLWILGPLDDELTVSLLAYGEGFTIGKYRTPLLRNLNPEKPTLNKDVVLGTWMAWHETIRASEHRAVLDYFIDDFGL